jgi:hypothetical protein
VSLHRIVAACLLAALLGASPSFAATQIEGGDGGAKKACAVDTSASSLDSLCVTSLPHTGGAQISSVTGTIAAALGANSSVLCMRLDPGATVNAYIYEVQLRYTTIVAYTTPVTAGRRLALFRGSGAACSGGTALTIAPPDDSTVNSEFSTAQGGDMRIATTGALTVTGITFEADPIFTCGLVHVGAAGASTDCLWNKDSVNESPFVIRPGQVLAIRNPAAMDAAGTWTLVVTVQWYER